jgi:hypothetical protein
MKAQQVWQPGTKDMKAIPLPRLITSAKRCLSILVVAAFISIAFIWAYPYPPPDYTSSVRDWLPVEPARELTDGERASRVVFRQILTTPPVRSKKSKIAFMFLTPGSLPFERLWDKFFEVYIHCLFFWLINLFCQFPFPCFKLCYYVLHMLYCIKVKNRLKLNIISVIKR